MKRTFDEVAHAITHKLFTPPKPIEVPDAQARDHIALLDASGQLMKMKKDDGHGHVNLFGVHHNDLGIYTLGMNAVTTKHPAIARELLSIKFPEKTLLCSEISCIVKGKQDRNQLTSINRAGDEKAASYATRTGIHPKMSIFNTLMWNGEDTTQWTNYDRYMQIAEFLKGKKLDHVHMTELVTGSLADARVHAKDLNWEGMVLYDPKATTDFYIGEDDTILRPFGSWKDKDYYELDFVAYAYEPSTAKSHPGAVRDFHIGLVEPGTGLIIPVCKCGGGMKKADRLKYADITQLPVAVEVKFENWTKHGALSHGSIVRVRDAADKKWKQCLATKEQLQTVLTKTKQRVDPKTVTRIIPRGKKAIFV
jgi:ATP-dependent DNA ligase